MAILHIVRCDACSTEADLIPVYSSSSGYTVSASSAADLTYLPQTPLRYDVPSGWLQVDGKQFCSWACLAGYADKRMRELHGADS